MLVQFETIDGHVVPAALIDPDFEFVEGRKDKDDKKPSMDSQILVFDNRHGHEIRIVVDNIRTIADEAGTPIVSVMQVEQMAGAGQVREQVELRAFGPAMDLR